MLDIGTVIDKSIRFVHRRKFRVPAWRIGRGLVSHRAPRRADDGGTEVFGSVFFVCRAGAAAWRWKSSPQPDGGEG